MIAGRLSPWARAFAWPRRAAWVACLALLALAVPALVHAQDARIRAQRDTLEQIRRERQALERRAAALQTSMHDLGEEVVNLDRRAEATAKLVRVLDNQLATINAELAASTEKLAQSEHELEVKRSALRERLADIYKRGPLFATQAMLSARSFGELVARYKYLHLLAVHDRALVTRVEQLHHEIERQRDNLVSLQASLEENRRDKAREEERLRGLQRERANALARARVQAKQTEVRLARLKATETQLANAIAALEASRRRAESGRSGAAPTASTIAASDYGKLEWPVAGPLIYTFGKAQTASNTTIRWDGIGIRAAVGTSVRAVAAGKVVSAAQLGTYGHTVIIDHGGGDYSIYGSLFRADVRPPQRVEKGQVIGTVGISDPDLPAHLHFEIRHGQDGRPIAVDPATWLTSRP